MNGVRGPGSNTLLPLPRWVLHPYAAAVVACVHLYLAWGHLVPLFNGDVQWTHIWKGFGALGGAYVFAALASRKLVRHEGPQRPARDNDIPPGRDAAELKR